MREDSFLWLTAWLPKPIRQWRPSRFWWPDAPMSPEALRTFKLHLTATHLEGIYNGLLGLAGLILKKTLNANDFELGLQQTAGTGAMLLALFWVQFQPYFNPPRFIKIVGFFTRSALIVAAAVTSPMQLIAVLTVIGVGNAAVLPAVNRIIQVNYTDAIRGSLFGYVSVHSTVIAIFMTYAGSHILEQNPQAYRWLFPIAGLAGIAGAMVMGRIVLADPKPPKSLREEFRRMGMWQSLGAKIRDTWQDTARFVRTERDFMKFEYCFFLYGCGFMSHVPLMTILLVDELELGYDKATWIQAIIPQLAALFLAPLVGRLYDRWNPMLTMVASTLLLGTFTLILCFCATYAVAVGAICLFAVAMLGIHMAWSLGSIYFAGGKESGPFMSVHVGMAGLRSLMAPYFGTAVKQYVGLHKAFLLSTAFFWVAAFCMWRLNRRLARERAERAAGAGLAS